MTYFDTHIHLLAPEWQEPVQHRLAEAEKVGIARLLQPGVRSADWGQLNDLALKYRSVYAAPGLHPLSAVEWSNATAADLRKLCDSPKVVAIGEIGLDALLDVDPQFQENAFRGQLEIAVSAGLPVLIHCRKKTAEVLKILHESGVAAVGGIWHGFSGSFETAQQAISQGLLIGIGPVLLRENVRKLPEVIKQIPAEMLVLETDAPDMASGPAVLVDVARRVAELRNWTQEETATITTANACRIFKMQDINK